MSNSSINLVNLDFTQLKRSLRDYLTTQEQFKDYNFDSSSMNVLLDLLSYNTYTNAFYLNMIGAEGFLDSAQMRESIFSHAKELNYLPRSAKSAVANITISFNASGISQPYVIRKGETFSAIVRQNSYVFSVASDQILSSPNSSFSATFDIYEGRYVADSFVVDTETSSYKISNENVDTDSLSVLVYENNSTVPMVFKQAKTLLGLNENSQIYFLQTSFDGKYEIIFGDGVLGRKPVNGSTIVLDYRVTSGEEANGARTFSANFDPTGSGELNSLVSVFVNDYSPTSTSAYAVNGSAQESLESIRYFAPRHFQTQERAVTASDYETLLKTQFPEIGAISVYGGEEVNPPRYGRVFVAVDIANVNGLPDSKKREYYSFLKSRVPLSIDPIFVEPEFTYVQINSKIKYNINNTTKTAQNLQASTVLAIDEFAQTFLNDFRSTLRYSKLVKTIDDVDQSIVSNQTDIFAYKKLTPVVGIPQNIDVDFNLPLKKTYYLLDTVVRDKSVSQGDVEVAHSVRSSTVTFNGDKCEIEDNGAGLLRLVKITDNEHTIIRNVGTVNYDTGKIQLTNFLIDSFDGSFFKLYVTPAEKDISITKNEILFVESDEINLDIEAIRE
jgi:hypothetical protein